MFSSIAYAQDAAAAAGAGGAFTQFLPIILIFGVFYFLLIRPQQKQQKLLKQMVSEAKRGDEVIMNSGIHGKIAEIQDGTILLQVAANTNVKMDKGSIQQIKGYKKA